MLLHKLFNHPSSFFQTLICVINKALELSFASFEPGAVFVLTFDKLVAVGFALGRTGFEALCDFRITDFAAVVYDSPGRVAI